MFSLIFSQKTTLYFFGSGYVVTFIFTLIKGLGIARAFWASLFGGLSGIFVWAVLIRILMILISDRELREIFNLPISAEDQLSDWSDTDSDLDDDDELSFDDLYSDIADDLDEDSSLTTDFQNADFFDTKEEKSQEESKIGDDGKFNLTVQGKTLRATPKSGAQASQKLLKDDK